MKQLLLFFSGFCLLASAQAQTSTQLFEEAASNGRLANEGFKRCDRYVTGWLAQADSATGLIPRNLKESRDFWNAWDAAADNYPFMVMTSAILKPALFKGRMLDMLNTEKKMTARIGNLPDTYSFTRKAFRSEKVDTSQVLFGSAEYMKDGLIPLTEWLGKSPWSDRMLAILDDLEKIVRLPIHLEGQFYGNSADVETAGDLLQVLSRMYWMTGNPSYLKRAVELGDYYLCDANLPTRSLQRLRLRDHGCEIVAGLSEVYAAVHYANPAKKKQWQPYMHEMLDCVLAKGRNDDGLFYNEVNPVTGTILDKGIADTWGYTLNALYTVYMLDSKPAYRDAVLKALNALDTRYRNFDWEKGSSDGYADAIEGALNLYAREPVPSVKPWLDSQVQVMWGMQQPNGIIEGWHGDGNFARTTLMYSLWKTAGITATNWDEQVLYGAASSKDNLFVSVTNTNTTPWTGTLKFGTQLHKDHLNLPVNYPRINQFQEWFAVDPKKTYILINRTNTNKTTRISGQALIDGYPVSLKGGEGLQLIIMP
ncbi:hypothetical protein GCM10023189_56800 [Nibrella saemangeumensis]|uniref:Uncharacterized protein n=1 Tax=Nibrella saemangeumensis TaxID=1084526 RepID=A0ABP8NM52_9BACT